MANVEAYLDLSPGFSCSETMCTPPIKFPEHEEQQQASCVQLDDGRDGLGIQPRAGKWPV